MPYYLMGGGFLITLLIGIVLTLPIVPAATARALWNYIWFFPAAGGLVGLLIFLRYWMIARSHNYLVCPECLYPIVGEKSLHLCSECGTRLYRS